MRLSNLRALNVHEASLVNANGGSFTPEEASDPSFHPYVRFQLAYYIDDIDELINISNRCFRETYHNKFSTYYLFNLATNRLYFKHGKRKVRIKLKKRKLKFLLKKIKKVFPIRSGIGVGSFLKFAFPIIRQAYPTLVALDLVSVQPMTGPIGGLRFYSSHVH